MSVDPETYCTCGVPWQTRHIQDIVDTLYDKTKWTITKGQPIRVTKCPVCCEKTGRTNYP